MKKDIHPTSQKVIFRDAGAGKDFIMTSTATSDEVEEVNGEKMFVIRLDVSSASHPFFTGKQNMIDRSGRVEKFRARMAKTQKAAE